MYACTYKKQVLVVVALCHLDLEITNRSCVICVIVMEYNKKTNYKKEIFMIRFHINNVNEYYSVGHVKKFNGWSLNSI